MISVASCYFSIKHWLMKIRLMFLRLASRSACFFVYFCFSVSGKRDEDKTKDIAQEEILCETFSHRRRQYEIFLLPFFLPPCGIEKDFFLCWFGWASLCLSSSTFEFRYHLEKFAFRVLLLKCCAKICFFSLSSLVWNRDMRYDDGITNKQSDEIFKAINASKRY